MIIAAAAAAAAASAATGRGDGTRGRVARCDADMVTPGGVARGVFIVASDHLIFRTSPRVEDGDGDERDERRDDDGDDDERVSASRFAPADDDPYVVDVTGEGLHAGTAKVDVPSSEPAYEWRWPLDALRGVRPRRYLLRASAIEIFLLDRSTYFLNLRSEEERARVYGTIARLRPPRCAPMDASASGDAPEALLRRSDLTRRWRDREMSNFDYLMALNAVAGRTYNDVTQYPVFPWVIADYSSEELDLDDPATYRDLSKPVGALNEARLARFRERHDAFDDPEIPKFHYGSHYSTAGTTIFYLIRLEPFTTLAHQLQGGKFDHADRLFDDVASAYEGVTTDMSDVKELVPEWYYLPEMFENVNRVDFGAKQSGRRVDDVRLPPWARDARDFVAKNRAALESEHVSKHLHLWIDLVFGYKQRGAEATKADNVFYYLTYEGAVDVDAIEDPTLLKATQDQIANFGQTPSQLLTKPHPPRRRAEDTARGSRWLMSQPRSACVYPLALASTVPAAFVAIAPERVLVLDAEMRLARHAWSPHTPDAASLPFTFVPARRREPSAAAAIGGFLLRGLARADASSSRAEGDTSRAPAEIRALLEPELARALAETAKRSRSGFGFGTGTGTGTGPAAGPAAGSSSSFRTPPCAATPDGRWLATGGHVDGSVKVYATAVAGAPVASAGATTRGGIVRAVAVSEDGGVLVAGYSDSTVAVWTLPASTSASASELAPAFGGDTKLRANTNTIGTGGDASRGFEPAESEAFLTGGRNDGSSSSSIADALRGGFAGGISAYASDASSCVRDARALAGVASDPTPLVRGRSLAPSRAGGTLRGPHLVLRGHGEAVSAVAVNVDLGVVVATSPRAGATIRGLPRGVFIARANELRGDAVAISPEGLVVAWERRGNVIRAATLDGRIVARAAFEGILTPLSGGLACSSDGKYVLAGAARERDDGDRTRRLPAGVALLTLPALRLAHVWELKGGVGARAFALQEDDTTLVVAGEDGSLSAVADPSLSMRLVDRLFDLGLGTMV